MFYLTQEVPARLLLQSEIVSRIYWMSQFLFASYISRYEHWSKLRQKIWTIKIWVMDIWTFDILVYISNRNTSDQKVYFLLIYSPAPRRIWLLHLLSTKHRKRYVQKLRSEFQAQKLALISLGQSLPFDSSRSFMKTDYVFFRGRLL